MQNIISRLFIAVAATIIFLAVIGTAFWVYEEIYFLSSDLESEKRAATEIIKYTSARKGFDYKILKGPYPRDYGYNNRELIWTLDGKIVVTLYFTYVPHDYDIYFSGKMGQYGR